MKAANLDCCQCNRRTCKRRCGCGHVICASCRPVYILRVSIRQRQIMDLYIAGKRCLQIARTLGMSHRTVSTHRRRVADLLGLGNGVTDVTLVDAYRAHLRTLESAKVAA